MGDLLEGLDTAIRETVGTSSRELTMEAVEFILAILWSRFPNLTLEEVLEGIVPGDEEAAHDRAHYLAAKVVGMFMP